jgi:hypothetical protein
MSDTNVIDPAVKTMGVPVKENGVMVFKPMRIVVEKPPVWNECVAMIGAEPRNTIFAWGDIIYNPDDILVVDYLIAHEEVHQRQQILAGGPEAWWSRYLDDVYFRLKQEVEAYAVQYLKMEENIRDRNWQYRVKVDLARKLSGPLYGNSLKTSDAMRMLNDEIKRIS